MDVVGIVVHRWEMQVATCFSYIYHDLWIPVYARSLVELQRNGEGEKKKRVEKMPLLLAYIWF